MMQMQKLFVVTILIETMCCSTCFSLRRGRRVCYLGWGSMATLGLIDASECIPTFGAGETKRCAHSQ